jgi:hypothetical protein
MSVTDDDIKNVRNRLSDDEELLDAMVAGMHRKGARDYDSTSGSMLKGTYNPRTYDDFHRQMAMAMLDDLIVVQVSERKFQLGKRRFIGGTKQAVAYVELEPTRYTMHEAFEEYQRRIGRKPNAAQ